MKPLTWILLAILMLVAALVLSFSQAMAQSKKGGRVILFDKDSRRSGYVQDNKIYDKDWHLKGYIKDGKLYDEDYRLKGYIKEGGKDDWRGLDKSSK